jgi:uncharacterized protein
MRAWIDIENPPQVQYLSPFKAALEAEGHDVVVSARNHPMTLELLRQREIEPLVVGSPAGASTVRKVAALTGRAAGLATRFLRPPRPELVVASSRPSALAAWSLRIPSFQFTDYEHSEERIYQLTRAYLVHPAVIDREIFLRKGFRADRLVPFAGLKEAISFAGVDLETVEPYAAPGIDAYGRARVLFRAPGEKTHYFVEESRSFALDLLARLAARDDVVVVYVPRYPSQATYLDRFSWRNEPCVLRESVPFVSLLKSVDAVISSGGTMLREAAYLGVPAYSIFRSEIGQVDRYLESIGRLTVLESPDELPVLRPRHGKLDPMPADPALPGNLVDAMVKLAAETGRRS